MSRDFSNGIYHFFIKPETGFGDSVDPLGTVHVPLAGISATISLTHPQDLGDDGHRKVTSLLAMLEIYADIYAKAIWELHKIEAEWVHVKPNAVLSAHHHAHMFSYVGTFKVDCEVHELNNAASKCGRVMQRFEQKLPVTYWEATALLKELRERLEDELKSRVFTGLTVKEGQAYKDPRSGWEEIIGRFRETTSDIEEMRRCFALCRYAASVFHSVSVVEHGLIALGTFIKVNDPKSGWTAVSGKLETLIVKTKYPDLDPLFQQHRDFLEQVHGTVHALKNAWRNKISHAHGKLTVLTPDFTPEIADEIIMATRAFMRRLSDELPS